MAPDIEPPPPDPVACTFLAMAARSARPVAPCVFAPAYLNEPNETARPRDEAAFAYNNRAPRLDEIEGDTWEPDRWRE